MKKFTAQWFALFAGGIALNAAPVTADQLQSMLNDGAKVTVIDVRNLGLYEKGHIPGAINIPAVFCAQKELPRLWSVVVYDAGLGQDDALKAAADLNAKPGIEAEILLGGFAAWQQAGSLSTHATGLAPEDLPLITYAGLQHAQSSGVVLVDLRKAPVQARQGASDAAAVPEPLTDLRKEFPAAGVASSPFSLPQTRQSAGALPPLIVLIDSGDGAAQKMGAALKANGISRFVILAGGESILARHGQPGMQRIGSSTSPPEPSANP